MQYISKIPQQGSLSAPVYHRQRLILFMLEQAGGKLSKIEIQKLLFLYIQQAEIRHYAFIPFHYGCYSFLAADDVDLLQKRGWIAEVEGQLAIQSDLSNFAWARQSDERRDVRKWLLNYPLRGEVLLKDVYRRFPYFASRSEIKERILNSDELKKVDAFREPSVQHPATLYTIGYEGSQFEDYLRKLIDYGIKVVCDVRRNPLSRKYGFSKRTLSHVLPKLGITYMHIPELGIASKYRQNLDIDGEREQLFSSYSTALKDQKPALRSVLTLLHEHDRIALTCFEREHHQCHRHCISNYIALNHDISVQHL